MQDHVAHVQQVIERLTEVNLILNPDKCHFAQQSVNLLGFCASAKGISLDPRKGTNVNDWPRPKTGKDIMKFLGITTYFREWIPNVSKLTAPLDALRSADSLEQNWTDRHESAFHNLKHALHHTPILRYPILNQPFYVATDASNVGIGAVLYQIIDGETRHISFMARALSKSERNYTTTKKELLAIIYALSKFHKYLWGRKFTLYTDHRALTYLHTQRVANTMMINWLDKILSYDFDVVHLPGLDNTLPDALSRLFPSDSMLEGGEDNDNKSIGSKRKRTTNVHTFKSRRIESHNSIPYSRTAHFNTNHAYEDMLTPPSNARKDILNKAHAFGHFGAEAIVKALHSDGIHWASMQKEALELVKQCRECQKYNVAKHGYHPLRPVHAFLPGDQWAIDLAGPLRTSFLGNNYVLVMVDLCTWFCIVRPLPNKQSDTIEREHIAQFSLVGFPRYLQSDNGTEFVNSLIKKLSEATGFDHRLSTPYHPRDKGVAERYVQTTLRTLRKSIQGATKDWDIFLPAVQLAMNAKISKRHDSSPFSLMFARKMNTFQDYRSDKGLRPLSKKELQQRIKEMQETVFPAISERVQAVIKSQKEHFDKKHYLVDFKEGSHANVRVRQRSDKLGPEYEGPYTIVHKTRGGTYVLRKGKASGTTIPLSGTTTIHVILGCT